METVNMFSVFHFWAAEFKYLPSSHCLFCSSTSFRLKHRKRSYICELLILNLDMHFDIFRPTYWKVLYIHIFGFDLIFSALSLISIPAASVCVFSVFGVDWRQTWCIPQKYKSRESKARKERPLLSWGQMLIRLLSLIRLFFVYVSPSKFRTRVTQSITATSIMHNAR